MAKLEIGIPLQPAYKPEVHRIDYFESAVTDLIDLNGKIIFEIPDHPDLIPDIKRRIDDSRDYYLNLGKSYSSTLIFEIQIPDEPINYLNYLFPGLEENEKLDKYYSDLIPYIRSEIFHLMIFSNLSKPAGIKARSGTVHLNGEFYIETFPLISLHRETLDALEQLNWIKYRELPLLQVITWFKEQKFSFKRHSSCQTERALNSFTKLFSENLEDLTHNLFWSLIGIEATFCNKKEGISQQIFDKTQVLFGEMTNYKKRLKMMYEFRSRLIHGDLDFSPENYFEDREEEQKFSTDLYQSTFLAIAILTCTIQELIHRNVRDFQFHYVLSNPI